MQPRIQHQALSRNHTPPPHRNHCHTHEIILDKLKELRQKPKTIKHNPPSADNETPEIKTGVFLEGGEDENGEFEAVEDGEACEDADNDAEGEGVAGVAAREAEDGGGGGGAGGG